MANRPYFYIFNNKLVLHNTVDFEWFSGFAISQKQKSIAAMHQEILLRHKTPLEISTKSSIELGRKLSAFNLKLDDAYLENVFQSSKVFQNGGPYDLMSVSPKEAKRDSRLQNSGKLIKFSYDGFDWPLEPKTVFYDYIYYKAVKECLSEEDLQELCQYNAFTDIEFNPKRSINTQARSIAIVLLIYQSFHSLPDMKPEEFVQFHKSVVRY